MHPGMYNHMDDKDFVPINLSIPTLVEMLMRMNYGEHRLLSALVLARQASPDYEKYEEYRRHTAMLQELLNKGYF